jgi:hypothetical protein
MSWRAISVSAKVLPDKCAGLVIKAKNIVESITTIIKA